MAQRVVRVQTGVRIERRILKVLKGLAELHDLSLGNLLEAIILHAFGGRCAFGADALEKIEALREVYGLDRGAADHHPLRKKDA